MASNKQYKHYILYKITNLINGKIYIGKHRCNRLDDSYFGSGKLLKKAIEKYGKENFIFHLEIDLRNQEELDLLEEMVVNKDFLLRPDVYNISRGGKNPCLYGENNPFYGKDFSPEHKQKMSEQFKGKHISTIHKQHISDGVKKKLLENPEIRLKFASLKGKTKCKNKTTGEIRFFKEQEIPENFEKYSRTLEKREQWIKETSERRERFSRFCSERNTGKKWFNNGTVEIFCTEDHIPDGYVPGRLSTTNIGRKLSEETKQKIRDSNKGKEPPNKGKVFITNGFENKYLSKSEELPIGWHYGMTRRNKNYAQD